MLWGMVIHPIPSVIPITPPLRAAPVGGRASDPTRLSSPKTLNERYILFPRHTGNKVSFILFVEPPNIYIYIHILYIWVPTIVPCIQFDTVHLQSLAIGIGWRKWGKHRKQNRVSSSFSPCIGISWKYALYVSFSDTAIISDCWWFSGRHISYMNIPLIYI